MTIRRIAALAAFAALALPAVACAHVTIQPGEAAAGSFTVENVRVPNEKDDASTTKVEVQMPDGFLDVSFQAVPGWKGQVTTEKISKPIEVEGIEVDEQVKLVTFTATGKGIGAGEFQDFPISVLIPDGKAGDKLTFKALQTYSDGDVTRWIGGPDADEPAPQLTLTAAGAEHGAVVAPASTVVKTETDKGLALAALIVAVLALLAGLAALAATRRSTTN
jgi:uncharacterized protein